MSRLTDLIAQAKAQDPQMGVDLERERRLLIAKELLNPDASVLIVTIDEKEYLRLGLLLEQAFPEARIVMVSAVISRSGVIRENEFTRTSEFVYFVLRGAVTLTPERDGDGAAVR